jgi:hypothetical protein
LKPLQLLVFKKALLFTRSTAAHTRSFLLEMIKEIEPKPL